MSTRVSWGKIWFAAFNGPTLKTLYRRKDLGDISYVSRVITHFVLNLVAMATGVGEGKIWIAAFDGATPNTPL